MDIKIIVHKFEERRIRAKLAELSKDPYTPGAERLGFTYEVVRRDGWCNEDGFVDIAIYAMLAADWQKMNITREA